MNPEIAQLALANLDASAHYLAEDFQSRNKLLNDVLQEPTLQSYEESVANARFLRSFVDLLPSVEVEHNYTDFKGKFCLNTPAEVRNVQGAVIWREERWLSDLGREVEYRPYYVLGKRVAGKHAELVLHEASTDNDTLHSRANGLLLIRAKAKHLTDFEERANDASLHPLSESELEIVFDADTKRYMIDPTFPGSFIAHHGVLLRRGRPMRIQVCKRLGRISSSMLGTHHVFDTMNDLAMSFEALDAEKALLQQQLSFQT